MSVERREPFYLLSWPITASVSARSDGREIARWELAERPAEVAPDHPGFDLQMDWSERAEELQRKLENNQEYLKGFFGSELPVCLDLEREPIERAEQILVDRGLSLSDVSLSELRSGVPKKLKEMPAEELYELLVEWSVDIEGADPLDEWVELAHPQNAEMCRVFALGPGWRSEETDPTASLLEAQRALKTLADPPLAELTFGDYLRWLYYHQTELSGVEPYEMRAVIELRELDNGNG